MKLPSEYRSPEPRAVSAELGSICPQHGNLASHEAESGNKPAVQQQVLAALSPCVSPLCHMSGGSQQRGVASLRPMDSISLEGSELLLGHDHSSFYCPACLMEPAFGDSERKVPASHH